MSQDVTPKSAKKMFVEVAKTGKYDPVKGKFCI